MVLGKRLLAFVVLYLTGCSNIIGNSGRIDLQSSSISKIYEYIEQCILCKNDAIARFGVPNNIDYDCATGKEKWIYIKRCNSSIFGGSKRITRKILLIFDKDGGFVKSLIAEDSKEKVYTPSSEVKPAIPTLSTMQLANKKYNKYTYNR